MLCAKYKQPPGLRSSSTQQRQRRSNTLRTQVVTREPFINAGWSCRGDADCAAGSLLCVRGRLRSQRWCAVRAVRGGLPGCLIRDADLADLRPLLSSVSLSGTLLTPCKG